ncbi:hypothetical protein CCP2SC5_60010 [Azospirillaceae bacterium]
MHDGNTLLAVSESIWHATCDEVNVPDKWNQPERTGTNQTYNVQKSSGEK